MAILSNVFDMRDKHAACVPAGDAELQILETRVSGEKFEPKRSIIAAFRHSAQKLCAETCAGDFFSTPPVGYEKAFKLIDSTRYVINSPFE